MHGFVDQIHLQPEQVVAWQRLNASIHLLDHLQRLHGRCEEEPERAFDLGLAPLLQPDAQRAAASVAMARTALREGDPAPAVAATREIAEQLRASASSLRARIMADVASGRMDVPAGTRQLESLRWLRRVTYHVWRACHHLEALRLSPPAILTKRGPG